MIWGEKRLLRCVITFLSLDTPRSTVPSGAASQTTTPLASILPSRGLSLELVNSMRPLTVETANGECGKAKTTAEITNKQRQIATPVLDNLNVQQPARGCPAGLRHRRLAKPFSSLD